jgi:hypothetical protein
MLGRKTLNLEETAVSLQCEISITPESTFLAAYDTSRYSSNLKKSWTAIQSLLLMEL